MFAARYPFRPLISFRSVTLEAAIDMYQLYTHGFQLYKRCTPVVQLGVCDTIAAGRRYALRIGNN